MSKGKSLGTKPNTKSAGTNGAAKNTPTSGNVETTNSGNTDTEGEKPEAKVETTATVKKTFTIPAKAGRGGGGRTAGTSRLGMVAVALCAYGHWAGTSFKRKDQEGMQAVGRLMANGAITAAKEEGQIEIATTVKSIASHVKFKEVGGTFNGTVNGKELCTPAELPKSHAGFVLCKPADVAEVIKNINAAKPLFGTLTDKFFEIFENTIPYAELAGTVIPTSTKIGETATA